MSPNGYSGPATIVQGEVRAEVQCGFHVAANPMADMKEWRGWYKGASELQAGDAQLVLEHGATGAINITRALQADNQGTFLGVGDPPAAG
jgi:hypothetical protein